MKHKTVAIIPAAGRGQRMLSMTDNCPKSMLPVGNKPLISYHLDKLIEKNINDVYIVVGYKKEVLINYVTMMYSNKLNVRFVEQKELLGLGHALKTAVDEINENEFDSLFIMLGDIIVQDDSIFSMIESNTSFVAYKEVTDYSRWCLLEMDNDNIITGFLDKPDEEPDEKNAVIGIYYFNNFNIFKLALNNIIEKNIRIKNEFQISSAMLEYIYQYNQQLIGLKCIEWFDFGEIETYNESKKHFNITRYFNNIKYANNSIIKTSSNYNKIQKEILWYMALPNSLLTYAPRLLNYSLIDSNVYYELEYTNGSSLQELFIYNYLSCEDWSKILKLIDDVICKFKFVSDRHDSNLYEFLNKNYHDRHSKILSQHNYILKQAIDDTDEYVSINDKLYRTYSQLTQYIEYKLKSFNNDTSKYSLIIHGDLVFSNILYEIGNNQIKLIDPRGDFNGDIIYGDIRYDIAKLCQCIIGKYDYIVNDLVDLTFDTEDVYKFKFKYSIYNFNESCDITPLFIKMVEKYDCKLSDILFITAIQFFTMIPLHADDMNHQIMMYLKFIELVNKSYELDKHNNEMTSNLL